MTLTLTITNAERLENGIPTRVRLDRHGAVIGRSPTVDWSLPDPQHYISAIHCEVCYANGGYTVEDKSRNGTFMNGAQTRMDPGPHPIRDGDVIVIGHYQIAARLEGEGQPAAPVVQAWGGWQSEGGAAAPSSGGAVDGWDRPAPKAAISGQGSMSQNWAPPPVDAVQPVASPWNTPGPEATPASGWSSATSESSSATSAVDVWGDLAASNVVDWARGGFGSSSPAPPSDPLGLGSPPARPPDPLGLDPSPPASDSLGLGAGQPRLRADPLGLGGPTPPPAPTPPSAAGGGAALDWGPPSQAATPAASSEWGAPVAPTPAGGAASGWGPPGEATPPPAQPRAPTAHPAASPAQPMAPVAQPMALTSAGDELGAFLAGAGLQPSDLRGNSAQAMTAAGAAMRRMVSGLVVMLEARARAKAQLGAQGTSLEFEGNNPLKFARAPEKAVAQLMNPAERGFMSSDRAIEDAFRDLQAHQVATLTAMKGALEATLERFSPQAIRERAESGGFMAKIMPSAREAALWQTYEREFEGVARGSDEAFMDVFAKEFRTAYEKVAADMKRRST